jgi:DNA invertase Pin-like site-specific DNA recombinase
MSHAALIEPQHLTKTAIVYVRQSTAKQLLHHQESTRRQYQLVERAAELGWPQPRIVVIDTDLGQSGASSTERLGFQRLVAAITMGEVGLVLVTEVSRLSRLNSDWHRVLELCAVFETLIADDEGVYDPRDPNDRLVLGLKGTLFAAELHILRARMRSGLLNKARRGALALRLPVGYRRLRDGSVVLDPDEQVRTTIETLFAQFRLLKTARAVQRYFVMNDLSMPRHIQHGEDYGQVVWVKPTYQMIQQILTSPVYAGTFVFGRRIQQVQPGDPPQTVSHRLPEEEWEIVVPDIYPAYLTREEYHANRETLRRNMYNFEQRRPGAPREGPALLQGLLLCGRCGRRMTVSYGKEAHAYVCRRAKLTYDEPQCQTFPQRPLDEAVRDLFLEAVQPAEIETLLTALDALEQERQATERQWQVRLERARYAVRLAQRQYDAVDPENRLVARELERRWNDALLALEALGREYTVAQRTALAPLNPQEQDAVRQLAENLPGLWDAPTTTARDHKRLLRLVIQGITLTVRAERRDAEMVVVWSGGMTTSHVVTLPPLGWHCMTAPAIVARVRELATRLPDDQIAETLNADGLQTQTGKPWTYKRVVSLRKLYGIATACPLDPTIDGPRGDGLIAVRIAAQLLGISPSLVHVWLGHGVLTSEQRVVGSYRWVRLTDADLARLTGRTNSSHLPRITDVVDTRGCTREEVWELVRTGAYIAHRRPVGQAWEWRLERQDTPPEASAPPHSRSIRCEQEGIPHYG